MLDYQSFRHFGGGRKGVFLLLRYVFIVAASYLLIFDIADGRVQTIHALMIAAALASNIALSAVSSRRLFAWYVEAPVLIADTLWISWATHSLGAAGGEFFVLYFFVLFLAAIGENLLMIVLGSMAVSVANIFFVSPDTVDISSLLLRLSFFFAVALFYGQVLSQIRRERQRADKGLAWARELEAKVAERTAVLQRLYEESLAASRAKSEFVATMSHELRTPLHIMLGYAEILRHESLDEADREHYFDRIEVAGHNLLTLIESTLEVGKLDAGRSPVLIERVAVPAFWTALRESCARLPHNPAVRLEWPSAVPDVEFQTDPRKLIAIARNIIDNALKFTEKGVVRPSVRLEGETIVFAVTDTGIGIRVQDHATVFEMFRQLDASDTRKHGGSGLGLYIVSRFVEQLGGSVEVESALGCGSTFTVRLPHAASETAVRDAA